jgi:hypothetical protein
MPKIEINFENRLFLQTMFKLWHDFEHSQNNF